MVQEAKSSLSRVIKSKDLNKTKYSSFEYEDCTPNDLQVPEELFPTFQDEKVVDKSSEKRPTKEELDLLNKQIKEGKKQTEEMKMKAEVYLQQAKERSEEKFQEAYEKGFKQGLEEGSKAGETKQKKILEEYTRELASLAELRDNIMKQSEKSIINLVLKISRKILQTELALNPELVKAIVKAGIERAISPGQMKLRINPEDAKFVQDNLSKITESTEIVRNIVIERDESIERGSCIVTNNYGDVDARIDEQLQEIEKECMKFLD